MVEKLIKDGKLDKLKVDQCKVYLRKFGLRLSGNKGVLIGRIKEHLEIIDGGGKKKYPRTSFVEDCKGDACTGDVVMFDMFSKVSRSATAPPCGTRVVAGRIVKDSYGAAKKQHTFTIEVLWSEGEKPLPPLHPLLIKGRNLYKITTKRQRWVDEEERWKILQEKHLRGFLARRSRGKRIHGKEIKKMARNGRMKENDREQILSDQKNQYQMNQSNHWQQQEKPVSDQRSQYQMNQSNHRQQQEKSVSDQRSHYQFRDQLHKQHQLELQHHQNSIQRDVLINRDVNQLPINPMELQRHPSILYENSLQMQQRQKLPVHYSIPQVEKPQLLAKPLYYQPPQPRAIQGQPLSRLNSYRVLPQHHQQPMQRLPCRFYSKGKCYFGEKCKYLHESR